MKSLLIIISLIVLLLLLKNNLTPQIPQIMQVSSSDDIILNYNFDTAPPWSLINGPVSYELNSNFGSKSMKLQQGANLELAVNVNSASPNASIYDISIEFYDDNTTGVLPFIFAVKLSDTESVGLGFLGSCSGTQYFYRQNNNGIDSGCFSTGVRRSSGIHTFTIRITPKGAYGLIDGINLSFMPFNGKALGIQRTITSVNKIVIGAPWTGGTQVFLDNLKVAKSHYTDDLNSTANIEKHFAAWLSSQDSDIFNRALNTNGSEGQVGYRSVAQIALGYAFLSATNNDSCSADKESTSTTCDKARKLFRKMALERGSWRDRWLSSATVYPLVPGSWLIWNKLDDETRQWLINILNWEANNVYVTRLNNIKNTPNSPDPYWTGYGWTYNQGFSRYIADTSAEDNGSAAMFLGAFSQLIDRFNIDNKANLIAYETAAKVYGFHTLTKGESDSIYGLYSRTMNYRNNAYILDNHNYSPSLNYSMALTVPANLYPLYSALGKSFPSEYLHNHEELWKKMMAYVEPTKLIWQITYPVCLYSTGNNYCVFHTCDCNVVSNNIFSSTGRDDWGGDLTWWNNAFALASKLFSGLSISYASVLEHEKYIRPEHLAFPQNSRLTLYAPGNVDPNAVSYNNKTINYLTDQNATQIERHILAYLINNHNLLLELVVAPPPPPTPTPTPSPSPCGIACNFNENRQPSIDYYCTSYLHLACPSPNSWQNPQLCHGGINSQGNCDWIPFGSSCSAPYSDCVCIPPTVCQYDYNQNQVIDKGDVESLLAQWRGAPSLSILVALVQNWGAVCN